MMDLNSEAKLHQDQMRRALQKISKITTLDTQTRRKLVTLFTLHLQNFQKAIILNRRRHQQRLHRRRTILRQFYLHHIMQMSTHWLEALSCLDIGDLMPQSLQEQNTEVNNCVEELLPLQLPLRSSKIQFFENILCNYSDEQWLATLRMRSPTFQGLCAQLRDTINFRTRNKMPPEKCTAIALYTLATGVDCRTVAMLFDVTNANVVRCLTLFVDVLLEKLGPYLITMPRHAEEYDEIRNALKTVSNMPAAIVGVMGILQLPGSTNGNESILQVMIDDRLLFRRVQLDMKKSLLFMEPTNPIAKLEPQLINDRYVPCFVLASAQHYSMRPWLMQAYADPISPHEYDFNEAAESLMQIKDNAFRRLLTRWQILRKKSSLEPHLVEKIIVACCALHNLLEETGEKYNTQWANIELTEYEAKKLSCIPNTNPRTNVLLEMRDFLARTISSTEI